VMIQNSWKPTESKDGSSMATMQVQTTKRKGVAADMHRSP
jgi:hypothetical protein